MLRLFAHRVFRLTYFTHNSLQLLQHSSLYVQHGGGNTYFNHVLNHIVPRLHTPRKLHKYATIQTKDCLRTIHHTLRAPTADELCAEEVTESAFPIRFGYSSVGPLRRRSVPSGWRPSQARNLTSFRPVWSVTPSRRRIIDSGRRECWLNRITVAGAECSASEDTATAVPVFEVKRIRLRCATPYHFSDPPTRIRLRSYPSLLQTR